MTTTIAPPENEVIWEQTRYDSGLYACRVERGDHDGGKLSVTLVGNVDHILHEETVKVDRQDLDKWRKRCAAVISNPDLRTYEPFKAGR